jgi:hypothetical protein|tara:strand:- start:1206 stop:1532 length:327 start_codon:yes stop_codon:yes gene_type:complete
MKKTDKEIMEDRSKTYGAVEPMWETIGKNQWNNFLFLLQKYPAAGGGQPTPKEKAHLAAMNMNVVKMVRSIQDTSNVDNYQDGRNYWTISGECIDGKINAGNGKAINS